MKRKQFNLLVFEQNSIKLQSVVKIIFFILLLGSAFWKEKTIH